MKREIIAIIALVIFTAVCVVFGVWLTEVIWNSGMPTWLKIWLITH